MKILNVHGPINLGDKSGSTLTSARPRQRRQLKPADWMLQKKCSAWRKRANRHWQRQVATGKSRIRRFVTEKPVKQQITLHEELYEISRREVNDPHFAQDIDWMGRTIEVIETSEQPVVTKIARLAEEVVIRRRGSYYVETIRATVRRQQLGVERVSDVKRAA